MILVTGATGTLGCAFARVCATRELSHHVTTRAELDITDEAAALAATADPSVTGVINTSGYVRVDEAEEDEGTCMRANALGASVLARACARNEKPFLTFSSDLVFDGMKRSPYVESDVTNPLSAYGRSKAIAERAVQDAHPSAIIVRTSAFFGPWDRWNFVTCTLDALRRGETVNVGPQIVSPTYVIDLANASIDLLLARECGIFHVANAGVVSWRELAELAARIANVRGGHIADQSREALGWRAARPTYSAVASERGITLPALEDALARYARVRELCV